MKNFKYLLFSAFMLLAVIATSAMDEKSSRSVQLERFIQELNRSNPNSDTLSDLYYDISDDEEQKEALKAATAKNITLTGQEQEQNKIRNEYFKSVEEKLKTIYSSTNPAEVQHENISLIDFKEKLKSKIEEDLINKFFKQLSEEDKDYGFRLAKFSGYNIPDYKISPKAEAEKAEARLLTDQFKENIKPSPQILKLVSFKENNIFLPSELVIVKRSGGDYSYGYIVFINEKKGRVWLPDGKSKDLSYEQIGKFKNSPMYELEEK